MEVTQLLPVHPSPSLDHCLGDRAARSSRTSSDTNLLFCECQVVAIPKGFLEVERRATTFEPSMLQEGNSVTQNFCFIQVMCGENDGSAWKTQSPQNEHVVLWQNCILEGFGLFSFLSQKLLYFPTQ